MMWTRLSNFQLEWDTLVERKKNNDDLTLPKISRNLGIVPFFEAYDTFADEFIGQANCPLSWIYREVAAVPAVAPALEVDQVYSTEHGSVAGEMVARLSHNHPHFRVDNATGYAQLVTATLGTSYAATIAPFKRTKNGRAALAALKAQFAGPAYWDREVKTCKEFLLNNKWTGTTSFTLSQFLAKHRSSYNSLQRCAEHVSVELPNERTRVGYLVDNIDTSDKDVTTALSHIRLDDTVDANGNPSGRRNDFESAVAFLLQTEPGKKKRGGKRPSAQISAAIGDDPKNSAVEKGKKKKGVTFKPTYGKTGVELRYHKLSEWKKLTKEQQEEVQEHRRANGDHKGAWTGKGPGKGPGNVSATLVDKATIAAMIASHDSKRQKEQEEKDALKQGLMSDLKDVISSQIAAVISSGPGQKKPLQKLNASVSSAETDANLAADEAVERCAASLISRFNAMGSKAGRRKAS